MGGKVKLKLYQMLIETRVDKEHISPSFLGPDVTLYLHSFQFVLSVSYYPPSKGWVGNFPSLSLLQTLQNFRCLPKPQPGHFFLPY